MKKFFWRFSQKYYSVFIVLSKSCAKAFSRIWWLVACNIYMRIGGIAGIWQVLIGDMESILSIRLMRS